MPNVRKADDSFGRIPFGDDTEIAIKIFSCSTQPVMNSSKINSEKYAYVTSSCYFIDREMEALFGVVFPTISGCINDYSSLMICNCI